MIIQSAKITNGGYNVTYDEGCFFIPNDPENRDYQQVLSWFAEGNSTEPELTNEELLARAKENKKAEVKNLRFDNLSQDLLAKTIDGVDFYVKTNPEINLFQSAILMPDDGTRLWGCYSAAGKGLVPFSKDELLSLAHHYEVRKNQEYNLCDVRREAIDALTSIEKVEAFDINQVFE